MYNQTLIILSGLGLFLASSILVGLYIRYATVKGILDIPNVRSSHQGFVPRGAGIIFLGLWVLAALLCYQTQLISGKNLRLFLPLTSLVALLGFWDDFKALPARKRLFWQFILGFCFLVFYLGIEDSATFLAFCQEQGFVWALLLAFLGLFTIVWSINLYNFMDGIDGIAAVEAFFVLGFGGLICYQYQAYELSLLAFAMFCAVAGFLIWNWPKASVFMGDVGSYCLGTLISLLAIISYWNYEVPLIIWFILYGVFWFDASCTLVRRFIYRKNIIVPHRDHAYQRLHQAGFSQQRILFGLILVNSILAFLACFGAAKAEYLEYCFLISLLLLILITFWVEKQKPLSRYS